MGRLRGRGGKLNHGWMRTTRMGRIGRGERNELHEGTRIGERREGVVADSWGTRNKGREAKAVLALRSVAGVHIGGGVKRAKGFVS